MGKLTTAERLNQIRSELNIDKKKFTSKANGKKRKKLGKHNYRFKLKKKLLLDSFTEEFTEYLLSLDPEVANGELENIETIFLLPTISERYDDLKYDFDKDQRRKRAFRKYIKDKDPQTLAEYEALERKFEEKSKKYHKKYNKRGFDLYNDRVIKVDPDDLIDRLKKVRKENSKINDKFIEYMDKLYEGGDMPDIIGAVNEKNDQIGKTTRKLIKSLEKCSLKASKY